MMLPVIVCLKIEKNETDINAVAYVDDELVYESNNPDSLEFELKNAYIPNGEGRIDFINGTMNTKYVFVRDHLGTTRSVLTDKGNLVKADMYFAYGAKEPLYVPPTSTKFRKEFTGKEFDNNGASTAGDDGMNLYYFGARYYDPEIIRWITTDPMEQFFDNYAYASNGHNPITAIDPDGEAVYESSGDLHKAGIKMVNSSSYKQNATTRHTYCNLGTQSLVNIGLSNPIQGTANAMHAQLSSSSGYASQVSADEAVALAQHGVTVVAAWANPSGKPGHVATVAPAVDSKGRPMVYNAGPEDYHGYVSIATAFSESKRSSSNFGYFVLTEDITKLAASGAGSSMLSSVHNIILSLQPGGSFTWTSGSSWSRSYSRIVRRGKRKARKNKDAEKNKDKE